MWVHRFTVRCGLPFPIDMLRYDACFPATEEDAGKMGATHGVVEVKLVHRGDSKSWQPSEGRWRSFVCTVIAAEMPVKGALR